ncbi:M20/M25/M40 family metallo-hydrolase [Granulicella sp. L46]|uniref:M20/M25/M40 family metallo-hydrolase n=1 Tax=Granulicella sp. L46 TaxID=1641865 RepID=UPI00131B38D1|nr:M20/M25/M40 family metallo-hydrolase [Granulicella sp. L46]
MKVCGVIALAAVVCGTAAAQNTTAPPQLPEQDRALSRQIFKEFIETNSQDSDGSVTAVSLLARKELLKAGFAPEDLILAGPNDRKQNLVVRYRGASGSKLKPVLIICHEDVVEARRADWSTDPYTFVEKDGFFYGRGTQDMKDADADVVVSFIRLKHEGYVPNRDIILALTADEEGGKSNGVSWLLKNRPELMQAAFVINPDGEGPTLQGGKATELLVEATEKTYADYRITATNPGGHSSEPRPDNAIYELMHALLKLEATPFPVELNNVSRSELEQMGKVSSPETAATIQGILKTPPDPQAIADFSKIPEGNATLRTTCVATMLQGGRAPNALPAVASANVNCRILPGHSQEETRKTLVSIFDNPKLTVEYMADDGTISPTAPSRESLPPPPLRADVMDPLKQVTAQMWPGIVIIPSMEIGASDSVYTNMAGLPSYGIGGAAIDDNGNRMHGRDERLGVESYYNSVEFFYLYLKALTK